MAETTLLHVWKTKILSPLNAGNENLESTFKKFYGRYPDLIGKYQRSVKDMVADSLPD